MLPFWIYRNDLGALLNVVTRILNYEAKPGVALQIPFKWDSVALHATKSTETHATDSKTATWDALLQDTAARQALQQTLLEASLFLPPLYVGMTNNLRRRYLDHTQPTDQQSNVFHTRLQQCMDALALKISTDDLLFVSLRTPSISSYVNGTITDREFNALVEQVLIQTCRPALCER